jgi:hypothetical protein
MLLCKCLYIQLSVWYISALLSSNFDKFTSQLSGENIIVQVFVYTAHCVMHIGIIKLQLWQISKKESWRENKLKVCLVKNFVVEFLFE